MTANTVNVNVTDDVISLNPESDAFIGGRAFNLHALPDDFQVNLDLNSFYIGSRRLTILWRVTDQSVTFSLDSYTFEYILVRVTQMYRNLVFLTVEVTDCY